MMHDEEFLNEAIKKYEESKGIHSLLLELRERRRAENDNTSISVRVDNKNATQAICEPLKELLKLRNENTRLIAALACRDEEIACRDKAIENMVKLDGYVRPAPCTKFKHATPKEWVAKLNEEVSEVIESLCSPAISREDRLREMVDVATVARSMAYATGYTLGEWEEMQRWVNDHNRRRGYMDEPEWEEMKGGGCVERLEHQHTVL